MQLQSYSRSIAIFAAREETHTILKTLDACRIASKYERCPTICDLLVNGNPRLVESLEAALGADDEQSDSFLVRLWFIDVPDKSHTWNKYFEQIWPDVEISYFVDGYAQPWKDAFHNLAEALTSSPDCYASSSIPTVGASARKQLRFQEKNRGINGNLFAMNRAAIRKLRQSGFHLPRGFYRTDPLIQLALKFDFNLTDSKHTPTRVVVVHAASYDRHVLSPFKLSDLKTQINRYLRQCQGDLESRAVKRLVFEKKTRFADWPNTVQELINGWTSSSTREWQMMVLRNPLRLFALRQVNRFEDWNTALNPAILVFTTSQTVTASGR